MPGLKERLEKDIAQISWKDLQPHAKRDAIIVIKPELDLAEVAVAIAEDDANSVQQWIEQESIGKPNAEQLTKWNQSPEKEFTALIVQPFVVVKEVD